jgi:hypothetical protein
LLAACDSVDDRPQTLQYIDSAILAPSCGKAQCHSSFKREVGDVYDTVAEARFTLIDNAQVVFPDSTSLAGPPCGTSYFVNELTVGNPSLLYPNQREKVRMPYDEPLPFEDIALIEKWIASGLEGAQCVPGPADLGCLGPSSAGTVVSCDSDGNIPGPLVKCSDTPDNCASLGDTCTSGLCLPIKQTCGQGTVCVQGACVAGAQ